MIYSKSRFIFRDFNEKSLNFSPLFTPLMASSTLKVRIASVNFFNHSVKINIISKAAGTLINFRTFAHY